MSRRNYSKRADRGLHSTQTKVGFDPLRHNHVAAVTFRGQPLKTPAKWFYIFKDGVKLAYNRNKAAAFAHALRCGGEVRRWDSVARTFVEVTP